jgi:hypothetical protein
MTRDLMQLLREDSEAQQRMATYGLDPSVIEEYEMGRMWRPSDPTADAAIAAADRDLARRRRR